MSFYNEKILTDWHDRNLRHYLDAESYPLLFAAVRAKKRSARLSRVDMGALFFLLTEKLPKRDEASQRPEDALLASASREEIAEVVGCHPSSINRAIRRINRMVKSGAPVGSFARRNGLILFHDRGYCFQPRLGDMLRARSYSEKQLRGQTEAHSRNIALSDELQGERRTAEEQAARFASLPLHERERLLASVAKVA